jgi:hypothetical protein
MFQETNVEDSENVAADDTEYPAQKNDGDGKWT